MPAVVTTEEFEAFSAIAVDDILDCGPLDHDMVKLLIGEDRMNQCDLHFVSCALTKAATMEVEDFLFIVAKICRAIGQEYRAEYKRCVFKQRVAIAQCVIKFPITYSELLQCEISDGIARGLSVSVIRNNLLKKGIPVAMADDWLSHM